MTSCERLSSRGSAADCWLSATTASSPVCPLSSTSLMKVAIVIQRYGTEVLGGSEHLCRLLAERLAGQHDIDVLTTCARDYQTWKNDYPEGTDRIRGVTVRRFANASARDLEAFNSYSDWIYHNPHSRADELEWLKQQGPWCPGLIESSAPPSAGIRRPRLLYVSLRADRPRPRGQPWQERARVDRS